MNEKQIAFMAILHQPHSNKDRKRIKRVHRLVVLPEYQGIGIGSRFLSIIANRYLSMGFHFDIVSSSITVIKCLLKNKKWKLLSKYIANSSSITSKSKIDHNRKSIRNNILVYSCRYIGS